ncbi:Tll0287-like domain-containing protein [Bradymonas sediminis]|uniref:Tll0287-like domain-containing protein n=1 Tax=Bradymonas sediminis TaxID=1548548 RepID=A0A2Z4FRG1_9DELT|nr:DUF3365 domain-containing protein [Bradymonas sediminis]AWV91248.1 hypothetical protein DN745_18710 [Bradymonas sediminis]TDP73815.1 uncharacterized protein DUF3365 [Bradymonas sediminis]
MTSSNQRWMTVLLSVGVAWAVSCERPEKVAPEEAPKQEESAPTAHAEVKSEEKSEEKSTEAVDAWRETADKADLMLRQRLMGKVMETVKDEGFVAAVTVCHGEAEPMTEAVGEEMNVKIGRVSERLRNPNNVGPDWVAPLIAKAEGKAHYATEGDALRVVKPLNIAQNCLNCHGQTDQLAEGVAEALQKHYPEDKATGYKLGDIRGWVWVEVH